MLKIKDSNSGFALIEVLVVIGMLIVATSLTFVMNIDNYRAYLFRNERDLVVSVLQKARSEAVSNVCYGTTCTNGKQHGVHFESNKYVIFQGASYALRDVGQDASIEANSNLTVTYSSQEVVFDRLSGQATPANFSANIQDSFGHSMAISVNGEGRINW